MSVPLVIRDGADGDIIRMSLAGEFDLAAVPTVHAHAAGLLERDAVAGVLVDLAGVTFLDSSGIGELVRCRDLAGRAGKRLRVVGAQGQVAAVLDLSGMAAHLTG